MLPPKNCRPPRLVSEIPIYGCNKAGLEGSARCKSQLIAYQRRIDRIAAVMTRSISHNVTKSPTDAPTAIGQFGDGWGEKSMTHERRIDRSANRLKQFLQIISFAVATNIVRLADAPITQRQVNRAAMITHMEPVSNVQPVSVHRQRLAVQCIDDHQRNELFWKLIRPVIV